MNKKLLVLALALIGVGAFSYQAKAEDDAKGISLEVGADIVSSYLWRGYNLGGLSIQPSVTLDWNGLYLCGWASMGADSWLFGELCPELDITIGYDNYGLQVDLTHLHYFDGAYFPVGGGEAILSPEQYDELSSSTLEAHAGFHLGELVEAVPLSIDWYTTVYGADHYINDEGNLQRAWSTYIQFGYDINLPLDIVLGLKVGLTPWKGMYSDYDEVWNDGRSVGLNNLQLRAEREFELGNLYINVWGEAMFNCYGVERSNIINAIGENEDQRLNGCIGIGVYFGNEW